jgi:hypothetical protein
VSSALSTLGFECDEDVYNIAGELHRFQAARGLPAVFCDTATLHALWRELLAPTGDGLAVLAQAGVAVDTSGAEADEKFGDIDAEGCDMGGMLVAVGLSRSVANLRAPAGALEAAKRQMISAVDAVGVQAREVCAEAERVGIRARSVLAGAKEVCDGAVNARARTEDAVAVVRDVAAANREIERRVATAKATLSAAARRTRILVVVLMALVVVFCLEVLWKRRKTR